MKVMTMKIFRVDVESVAHSWHNATHEHEISLKRKTPRSCEPRGKFSLEGETSMKKPLATAITSEKSI
jgi:hypothetical protein